MTITIPESSMATSHIMEKAQPVFPKAFTERFNPYALSEDYGVAVDLGTTTIAIYLCNLARGEVVGSAAIKNSQAIYGDDVMSRITAVVENSENLGKMHDLVIRSIEWGVENLFSKVVSSRKNLSKVVVVGNPTMIHFLAGITPSSIGVAPFVPAFHESKQFMSEELGFNFSGIPVRTLPNVSGFIGADILAAAVAIQMESQPSGTLLIDIGTNGELMLKAGERLYATSCATGPAFEGATLSCGMQGIPGAIRAIEMGPDRGVTSISIINPSEQPELKPRGISGAGILNIISNLRQAGIIKPDGAFSDGSEEFFLLREDSGTGQAAIYVSQKDIRSVQLGKSALMSGIEFLLGKAGIERPEKIIVAGTMGSHIKPEDLVHLGMIPNIAHDNIEIAGNLAGSGAVMVLCDTSYIDQAIDLSKNIDVIELASNLEFQKTFIKNLSFPEEEPKRSHF